MPAFAGLLAPTLVLFLGGGIAEPPAPNFDGPPTDYMAWYEATTRLEDGPDKNGAELYEPLIKSVSADEKGAKFAGFRSDKDTKHKPAPWDPKDHPEWEAAYKNTRELRDKFRAATMRPYVLPAQPAKDAAAAKHRYLLELLLPTLGPARQLVRATSEAAWRMEDGKASGAAIVSAAETSLRAARQCERFPNLLGGLVGIACRHVACEDLQYALHHEALSAAQRRSAASMLTRYDIDPPALEYYIVAEFVMQVDFVQRAANKSEPELKGFELDAATNALRSGKLEGRAAIAALESWRDSSLLAAREKDVAEAARRFNSARENAMTKLGATGAIVPVLDRYLLLRARAEAERRALRLLLEMHMYREKNQKWPASLDDLPKETVDKFGIDPFSNKRFRYLLKDGQPLLYSVAQDGDDDGGKHDEGWADKDAKDGDFVFWPVQL